MSKVQGIFLIWLITMSLLLILPKFLPENFWWKEGVKFLVFLGGILCIVIIKFVL